jgi:integrase
LSKAEESRLMAVLPKKYRPMVIVSLNTGLRKSEQLNLQWRDVDFRQGLLQVRNSKPGDSRYIPMNAAVVQALKTLPRRIHSPFVFAGRKAEAHMNDLPKYWEEYLKKAKIENFHWHDLRHTFASRLVMAGADLYTVKKLLGHHDMKMTERYAHLAPDFLKGAVDLLTKKTGTRTGTKKN